MVWPQNLRLPWAWLNALIKRLVQKGYIKVKNAPSRRYKYYITPEGFVEKGRLVSKYIANSFKFFGEVRRDYEMLANQVSASLSAPEFVVSEPVRLWKLPKWCLLHIT